MILQFAFAVSLLVTTLWHIKKTRPPSDITPISLAKLPTLSVAIPAEMKPIN